MSSALHLIPFLDVTYLEEKTDPMALLGLCESIKTAPSLAAAICVYTRDLALVRKALAGYPLAFASVINFPKGNSARHEVQAEIVEAIQRGATELDVVAPYQQFLAGEEEEVRSFIVSCRRSIPREIKFKLILETGEINHIGSFSLMACENGVDFIKTSTGKVKQGASLEATAKMLTAIKDYHQRTHQWVGLKVSGGVRSIVEAERYTEQARELFGKDLTPSVFRIGASQLFRMLLEMSGQDVASKI
ncbi:MAG: deoxyribose-phosphate aldolase [Gammaproteobacteria bacterium 39-13]|nr:deoxyribose-phosphate aldolase [Gammaproteobacteria bacterium]OJV90503.1 MAG: deoxyribose-phosphate aldolase [Gammaproteobacteria bacterium 39-13]